MDGISQDDFVQWVELLRDFRLRYADKDRKIIKIHCKHCAMIFDPTITMQELAAHILRHDIDGSKK